MKVSRGIAVSLFAFGLASVASATDFYWIGGGGDNYITTAANWSLTSGGTPCTEPPNNAVGSEDVLVFDNIASAMTVLNDEANTAMNYAGYRFQGSVASVVTVGNASTTINLGPVGIITTGDAKAAIASPIVLAEGCTNVIDNATTVTIKDINKDVTSVAAGTVLVKRGSGTLGSNAGYGSIGCLGTLVLSAGTFTFPNTAVDLGPTKVVFDGAALLDLFGTGLSFAGGIEETANAIGRTHGICRKTSTQAKTLKLSGSTPSCFSGNVTANKNNLSLTWAPNSTEIEFVWSRGSYDNSAGTLSVQGAMRFTDGGYVKGAGNVLVSNYSTFTIDKSAGAFSAVPFTIRDVYGAKVKVENGVLPMSSVKAGASGKEKPLPDGCYSADDLDWLEGDGLIVVGDVLSDSEETVEATWTGGGETTSVLDEDNWGGTLPPLTDGSLVATFPDGAEVGIPAPVDAKICRFKGIIGQGALTFTTTSSSGWFTVGGSGVTVEGALTLNAKALLVAAQTWTLNADSTIGTEGGVRAKDQAASWTILGGKKLSVRSTNYGLPSSIALTGSLDLYADNALGGRNTTISQNLSSGTFTLHGGIYDSNFSVGENQGGFKTCDAPVTLNGKIENTYMNGSSFTCDTETHFCGGLVCNNNNNNGIRYNPVGTGVVYIANVPMTVKKMVLTKADQELHVDVGGNVMTRGLIPNAARATVYAGVENILRHAETGCTDGFMFGSSATDAALDLQGHDQIFNIFFSQNATAKVTSETEAWIRLWDNALNEQKSSGSAPEMYGAKSQTNAVVFAGCASFSKEGALDHTLTGVSTSTGRVQVVKGRLIFGETASWENASEVIVKGDGVLDVRGKGRILGKGADMVIEDYSEGTAKVCVPIGSALRVKSLTVNGESKGYGTYTGGFVSGGAIRVSPETPGLLLMVR